MEPITFNKLNRIILVVLLGFITLQTSCKKEEYSIDGTTWKGSETADNYRHDYIMSFQENTFTLNEDIIDDSGASETDIITGTYDYNHPNVTLHYAIDDKNYTLPGTISRNQLTLHSGGSSVTFTKQ